jgi:hypothetical protein
MRTAEIRNRGGIFIYAFGVSMWVDARAHPEEDNSVGGWHRNRNRQGLRMRCTKHWSSRDSDSIGQASAKTYIPVRSALSC